MTSPSKDSFAQRVAKNRCRNTFAYMSSPSRRRSAGSSPPGVGVNRYDQPRSGYEKSTLTIPCLIQFARFTVSRAAVTRSPRLAILPDRRVNAATIQNTLQLGDHLGIRLSVLVLPRRRFASCVTCPIDATLAPAGLVKKLHRPSSSRVRVQQQLWVLQHRSARITSHFHGRTNLGISRIPTSFRASFEIDEKRGNGVFFLVVCRSSTRDFYRQSDESWSLNEIR